MTYDEIIEDDKIAFVVLRPSIDENNPGGITILRKSVFSDVYSGVYEFERIGGASNNIAYMVRKGD